MAISRRVFVAAGAASALTIASGAAPALAAATNSAAHPGRRPLLRFSDPALQTLLGSPYQNALVNLLDVNSIPYDPGVYNRTGLLTDPPGLMFRAGGGYEQPWTRDASINCWNAGSLLSARVARNTLWAVCERREDGQLIVQQDNQWWDQVIWAVAAWSHHTLTGDRQFLPNAYETVTNTLAQARATRYDKDHGLFRGPAVMQDGIAGYPTPPYEPGNGSSFVLDHEGSDQLMCLSTNCLHVGAFRSAARMAQALGRPQQEIRALHAEADELRRRINEQLWIRETGLYGYFLHGQGRRAGELDPSEESLGLALAVIFGVADRHRTALLLDRHHRLPHGVVSVWPHFGRFSDERPGRHEGMVWPMIQGYWAQAAALGGRVDLLAEEISKLASLVRGSDGEFYELYDPLSGAVHGGWQVGHQWDSQPQQTWSATAYLSMVHNGVFGMRFDTDGLRFAPSLPDGWGPVRLSALPYRDATLDVTLNGRGNRVRRVAFDGRHAPHAFVPADSTGTHRLVIELA
jgi:hypothetical protein